jgi:ribonuclease Y
MNLQMILTGVVALFLGIGVGFFWYKKTLNEKAKAFKAKMARAREIEEEILEEAKKKADNTIEDAKKKADQIKEQAEDKILKLEEARMVKIDQIEARLLSREEKIDEKISKLDEDKEKLKAKDLEIQEIINTQNQKLSEIAKLSPEEAKEALFANMQQMYEVDIQKFVDKYKKYQKRRSRKRSCPDHCQSITKDGWRMCWRIYHNSHWSTKRRHQRKTYW